MSLRSNIFLALTPRHWLKWLIVNIFVVIAIFISLAPNGDPRSDDPTVYERTGSHVTFLTLALFILAFFTLVVGGVHCHRKTREQGSHGAMHVFDDSLVGTVARAARPRRLATYSDRDPLEQTIPRPEYVSPLFVVDHVDQKPVVHSEEHEGFVINDRRRLGGEVD